MPVQTIGVIGAGTMGGDIAQIAAAAGLGVTLVDVSDAVVAKSLDAIRPNLKRMVARGKMTEPEKEAALALIRATTVFEELATADVVIEAATEKLRSQGEYFQADRCVGQSRNHRRVQYIVDLDNQAGRGDIAFRSGHWDAFLQPLQIMSLVEIVRGLHTSDAAHDAIEALVLRLGKSPITVKSGPGFVNRILLPMINEAFFVLAEGDADATEIDQSMKLGCNHPIGPLALADLIGLDVLLAVRQTIRDEFAASKYRRCPLLKEMVAAGYLGRKSGRGVYRY
jgi:3-hydroxybutyryl-CoA dehydrogenase